MAQDEVVIGRNDLIADGEGEGEGDRCDFEAKDDAALLVSQSQLDLSGVA